MKENNLKKLSVEDLVKQISPSSLVIKELWNRGVLRSHNIVGDLGEYYAVKYYNKIKELPNLTLAPPGVKNVDALSREGEIYSIKCVTSVTGTTGSFWDPDSIKSNKKKFEYLIIVILDEKYQVNKILQLSWDDFMKHKKFNKRMNNYNISLTQKLINKVKTVYKK